MPPVFFSIIDEVHNLVYVCGRMRTDAYLCMFACVYACVRIIASCLHACLLSGMRSTTYACKRNVKCHETKQTSHPFQALPLKTGPSKCRCMNTISPSFLLFPHTSLSHSRLHRSSPSSHPFWKRARVRNLIDLKVCISTSCLRRERSC